MESRLIAAQNNRNSPSDPTESAQRNQTGPVGFTAPEDLGREYEVVRLRLQPLTLAYFGFASVFLWFEIYSRWLRNGWMVAFTGGSLIAACSAIAAYIAWRRERKFATLVPLLLTVGILLSIVVPVLAGVLVYNLT